MYYVMSDIHGQYAAFLKMLDLIQFTSTDRMCVLGDVIDRGPDGIATLQHVMRAPNISMITGNHEYMMFDALTDKNDNDHDWYYNGYEPTIDAYGKLPDNEMLEILVYISRLQLQRTVKVAGRKYTLVHGRPKLTEEEYTRVAMYDSIQESFWAEFDRRIWLEFVPGAIKRDDTTFVFGHRTTNHYRDGEPLEIYFGDGCIGIDCGCAFTGYPGRLGCLRLNDLQTFYVDL